LPQAAQQAGIPATDDFNRGDNEGVGYFEVNQKNGWRWNGQGLLAAHLLRPAQPEVWTAAQVSRLIVETAADGSRRCTGVQVLDPA
jgi:choline dehydrogenase